MNALIIIPARYHSTRLPGKILLDIDGQTMLQRVLHQIQLTSLVQQHQCQIVVATDHQLIVEHAQNLNVKVILTSDKHPSGTDRLAEVCQQLQISPETIIINVQGDEPLIPPANIDQVANNLNTNTHFDVATLYEKITDVRHFIDPNVVKVVTDLNYRALYFSRAPIPTPRDQVITDSSITRLPEQFTPLRHIGLYAYRANVLYKFINMPESGLEQVERLEQLRLMHHGMSIHIDKAIASSPPGIDTEENLAQIVSLLHEANQI